MTGGARTGLTLLVRERMRGGKGEKRKKGEEGKRRKTEWRELKRKGREERAATEGEKSEQWYQIWLSLPPLKALPLQSGVGNRRCTRRLAEPQARLQAFTLGQEPSSPA